VDELADAIADDVPQPIALFGHSLGALLAFEVARRLTRAGRSPVHLIVSGHGTPGAARKIDIPRTDDDVLRHADVVCGGVPAQVRDSPEVLDHFLPILRADLELARAYVLTPDVALTCPITAITGATDPLAPPSSLAGWERHTGGSTEVHVLPGGHFALQDQRSAVLDLVLSRLDTGSARRLPRTPRGRTAGGRP
jgi:surfactin synthase thioesterase subunit